MTDEDKPGAASSSGGPDGSSAEADSLLRAFAEVPSRPAPEPDPVRVGHYRIVERIGRGGMGVVYRSEDERLRRLVALKVLPRSIGDDAVRRRRFFLEARAAAAINHPNVATIYDVGEAEGRLYIAMELVQGTTLRARFAGGPLLVPEAMSIVRGIALGLAKAHEIGIVHRDVKPENVMLTRNGDVKILDFGLAKVRSEGQAEDGLDQSTGSLLTLEGAVLGTPGYMSPEQARGGPVDARSDVFSLGVMVYELVTGTRPFDAATTVEAAAALLRDKPPPIRDRNPGLPVEIAAVVERCLAKEARDRYASAGEALAALERALLDSESATSPQRGGIQSAQTPLRNASRAVRRAGSALLVACTLGLVAFAWRSHAPTSPLVPLTSVRSSVSSPAPRGLAITDHPPPKTTSANAAAEYAAGLQAFRDATIGLANEHFERAVQLDPNFAAANLWLTIWGQRPLDDQRHFVSVADLHRSDLSERDAALLATVKSDLASDIPDRNALEARWRALAARFSDDAAIAFLAGAKNLDGEHPEAGIALLDRAIEIDPKFAWAYGWKAADDLNAGKLDEALANVEQCLAISPSAPSCLRRRVEVEAARGECSKIEDDARQMVATEPDSYLAYESLASALVSRNAPPESIVQAWERRREHMEDYQKKWEPLDSVTVSAWLAGDLNAMIARFPDWENVRLGATTLSRAASVASMEVRLFIEAGEPERGLPVADDYMKRMDALTPNDPVGALPWVLALRRQLGRISAAEERTERNAALKEAIRKEPSRWANLRWFDFALPLRSTEEARQALDELPEYSPLPPLTGRLAFVETPPLARNLAFEETMGRVLLLAGKTEEAIPHLRTATAACFDLISLLTHMSAAEELGEALATRGDKEGACVAFGEVTRRWPSPKPRSITVEAARAGLKKLDCAKAP